MKRPLNVEKTLKALLTGTGKTSPQLRQQLVTYGEQSAGVEGVKGDVPAGLIPYLDKVAHRAYQIGDKEIASLKKSGLSEDEIFEITVATAIGAGLGRMTQGLKALAAATQEKES